jgi:hypothetical protein
MDTTLKYSVDSKGPSSFLELLSIGILEATPKIYFGVGSRQPEIYGRCSCGEIFM